MKVYKASALAHKGRSDILNEAMDEGVIIQRCRTNGKLIDEMVIISKKKFDELNK